MTSVFVTGATGYVGRRLVPALQPETRDVTCLVRDDVPMPKNVGRVRGDLTEPGSFQGALRGHDVLVHAAAMTGKAPKRAYHAVNVEGTRALVDAARSAGVGHVVLVSSIAAKFADVRRYPYARSKIEAERIVVECGIPWTIVRPTIILGPGAPVLAGLSRLAGAPVIPMFGGGRAPIQPIGVDDLVRGLVLLCGGELDAGVAYDVGGPDCVTMAELLQRIRKKLGKKPRSVTVPAGPTAWSLGVLETFMLPLLPFTAGQLASFTQDGVVESNALLERLAPMAGVDQVLAESIGE